MRSWICEKWGAPSDLRLGDLPFATCGKDDVVIDVRAWGVNYADLVLISGTYQARPAFPFSPGMEIAGVISEIGLNVQRWKIGDRVSAYVEFGGFAARVVAPHSNVVALPERISWAEAAAFPVPYATALLALERSDLRPGETVLVGGAAGSVGLACTALAHNTGARVLACVSSDTKAALAEEYGADRIVRTDVVNLADTIEAAVPEGVDIVFDPVGGAFFEAALNALRYGGRLVSLGFASGEHPLAPVNRVLARHLSIVGSSLGLTCHNNSSKVVEMFDKLGLWLAEGRVRPTVDLVLPFHALPHALTMLANRAITGRVVLCDDPRGE